MIQESALIDKTIVNYIMEEQAEQRDRQRAYLRKAITAQYAMPAQIQHSRRFQDNRKGNEAATYPALKSAELELRTWLGLTERGLTQDKLGKFKRRLSIGVIAIVSFLGIVLTPVQNISSLSAAGSGDQPVHTSSKIIELEPGAEKPALIAEAEAKSEKQSSMQDSELEPFTEDSEGMHEW